MNNSKLGNGGKQGDSTYPFSPPLTIYTGILFWKHLLNIDAYNKRQGTEPSMDYNPVGNMSNPPSINLMPIARNPSDAMMASEEHVCWI